MTSPDVAHAWHLRYGAETSVPVETLDPVTRGLLAHRSVRSFSDRPLPVGTIETAIAAAQSASSSSNLQIWSVIAVEDSARKERLSRLAGDQAHIRQAPLLLVWVVDLGRLRRIAEREGAPSEGLDYLDTLLVGVSDAGIAAQNAVVSLEASGLGIVYLGALRNNTPEVARELGLPPLTTVAFGLAVGYPDPAVTTHVKPRLPQSVVLHRERYTTTDEEAGVRHYDELYADFQKRQGLPERSWTSTVAQRIGKPSALHGREHQRAVLEEAGFKLK
ncbi:NADPH-dependent oxidoreductase [Acetobacter estunensis]|uniref:NADPH-dependent oxidoreductase n=1 Tax=Acetobacter estunensis TaxID=104097 RepID=UPI001C2D2E3E|nr:NADPH-dependent oxidoreductase [Acetobacter estunensis]MBV1838337.1 NADPH-dependent oxidoreductase [Acetobacter estunensis]